MKRYLYIVMVFCFLLPLCSCNDSNRQDEKDVDQMSADEQLILDALIVGTKSSFTVPSKVRILDVSDVKEHYKEGHENYPDGYYTVYLTLQGENQLGGSQQKDYILYLNDILFVSDVGSKTIHEKGYIEEETSGVYNGFESSKVIDIGKINKAIKTYYEDLGIN